MKLRMALAIWLLVITGGMFALQRYSAMPGAMRPAPAVWPAGSTLQRMTGSATLVMMSHPKCPCTRASLAELQSLLSEYPNALTTYVLFIRPKGVGFDWTRTDLWRTASQIDGVHVVIDDEAREADQFKGLTSGQVVLYDAGGQLKFSGGITAARGHIGDNLGMKRIAALLRGEQPDRADSPVFGCPLHAQP